jgi:hypothetical protein
LCFLDPGICKNTFLCSVFIWYVGFHVFKMYVFKLVCTRWENFIRIGITVLYLLRNNILYLKSWRCQLWIWWSQMPFYWRCEAEPVKQIFTTIKSTIDTNNSSNTVLLKSTKIKIPGNIVERLWHINNVKISSLKCKYQTLFGFVYASN